MKELPLEKQLQLQVMFREIDSCNDREKLKEMLKAYITLHENHKATVGEMLKKW